MAIFLTAADSRASMVVDVFDTGVPVLEDLFADTVNVVCFEPTIVRSGIAADTISEDAEAALSPVFGPVWAPPPVVTSAVAMAALDFRATIGGDSLRQAILSRVARLAVIPEIGIAALAGWVLSFVAWQVWQTSPHNLRRMRR